MLRIAVSGTHNSGKTTLAQWISEEYGIRYVGEQARNLLEKSYDFSELEVNIERFKKFQREVLDGQIADLESVKNDSFVMDRTPVDSLAYVHYQLSSQKSSDMRYYKSYERDVEYAMSLLPYNEIFFLPFQLHDIDMFYTGEEDKFRNLNPLYLKCISDFIEYWFLKKESEFLDDRIKWIRWNLDLSSIIQRKILVQDILEGVVD